MNAVSDPNTTTRQYSLFAEADQRYMDARRAQGIAHARAERNPSPENITAFLTATAEMEAAKKNIELIQVSRKYLKGGRMS